MPTTNFWQERALIGMELEQQLVSRIIKLEAENEKLKKQLDKAKKQPMGVGHVVAGPVALAAVPPSMTPFVFEEKTTPEVAQAVERVYGLQSEVSVASRPAPKTLQETIAEMRAKYTPVRADSQPYVQPVVRDQRFNADHNTNLDWPQPDFYRLVRGQNLPHWNLTCSTCAKAFFHKRYDTRDCFDCYRSKREQHELNEANATLSREDMAIANELPYSGDIEIAGEVCAGCSNAEKNDEHPTGYWCLFGLRNQCDPAGDAILRS